MKYVFATLILINFAGIFLWLYHKEPTQQEITPAISTIEKPLDGATAVKPQNLTAVTPTKTVQLQNHAFDFSQLLSSTNQDLSDFTCFDFIFSEQVQAEQFNSLETGLDREVIVFNESARFATQIFIESENFTQANSIKNNLRNLGIVQDAFISSRGQQNWVSVGVFRSKSGVAVTINKLQEAGFADIVLEDVMRDKTLYKVENIPEMNVPETLNNSENENTIKKIKKSCK